MAALPHMAGPGGLPRQPVVGAHGLASLSSAAQAQPRLRLEQVCPAGPATVTRVPDHHDILAMPLALQPPAVETPLQLAGTPKGSPVFLDMCPNPPPTLSPGHPALPRPLRQPLAGDPSRMLGPSRVTVPGQERPSGGSGAAWAYAEGGPCSLGNRPCSCTAGVWTAAPTPRVGPSAQLPHRDPRDSRGEGVWRPGPEGWGSALSWGAVSHHLRFPDPAEPKSVPRRRSEGQARRGTAALSLGSEACCTPCSHSPAGHLWGHQWSRAGKLGSGCDPLRRCRGALPSMLAAGPSLGCRQGEDMAVWGELGQGDQGQGQPLPVARATGQRAGATLGGQRRILRAWPVSGAAVTAASGCLWGHVVACPSPAGRPLPGGWVPAMQPRDTQS